MGISILDDIQEGDYINFDVRATHPSYDSYYDVWETCRDTHGGEEKVKARGEKYLPKLSGQSQEEYEKYKLRAQFFGATYRTVESYLGMLFRKGISLEFEEDGVQVEELDEYMERKLKIVTEDGKSIYNFIHDLVEQVIITNRVGVLLDVPKIDPVVLESMTLEDYNRKQIKPLYAMYHTESIINWHTEVLDGQVIPTMFVLHEPREKQLDQSLVFDTVDAYRILYLENWDDPDNRAYKSIVVAPDSIGKLFVESVSYPTRNGAVLKHIPFFIFTDRGLDYRTIHNPMIKDLAHVNLGHYRNSADLENELHFVGIKTIYFPGWDKKTYGNPHMGGALAGPKDSTPTLIEPSSDSSLRISMTDKQNQIAILGAERVSLKGKYIASAETARITQTSEASILGNMVINLNEVLSRLLQMWIDWYNDFIRFDGFRGEIVGRVVMSNDFTDDVISGADALNWLNVLQQGGISYNTYWNMMKQREVYEQGWTIEQEKRALEETQLNFAAAAGRDIIRGNTSNPFFTKLQQQVEESGEQITDNGEQTTDENGNELPAYATRGRGADQSVPIRGTEARVRRS